MASEWFYTVNGQQAPAPATAAQLKQMASSGQLQPTDLVWQEGMASWVAANSIKGLFSTRGPSDQAVVDPPVKSRSRSRKAAESSEEESSSSGLLGWHQLLVLLLSVCTLGVFGLIYAYVVCIAYAEQFTRTTDTAGRPLGRGRHPLGVLLLSYVTLGIYYCFWVYRALQECRAFVGRPLANPRTDLVLMLLFPPYGLYLSVFRLPELIREGQALAKTPESIAVNHAYVFLNPCLFPALPLLTMAQQEALNQLWLQSP